MNMGSLRLSIQGIEKIVGGIGCGTLGEGVVYIVYFLDILFMFTGENILVCCFGPDGGIWASGTMLEVAATSVGAGAAPKKSAASDLA